LSLLAKLLYAIYGRRHGGSRDVVRLVDVFLKTPKHAFSVYSALHAEVRWCERVLSFYCDRRYRRCFAAHRVTCLHASAKKDGESRSEGEKAPRIVERISRLEHAT
ncbi:unnamed protein product, partial [Ixodes pacificus]